MKKIEQKLFNLAVWASVIAGYLTFAVVACFSLTMAKDEGLKKTTKLALWVVLVFFAAEVFFMIFNYIGNMFNGYYLSDAYTFYKIATNIVSVIRIITVIVFAVLEVLGAEKKEKENHGEEE